MFWPFSKKKTDLNPEVERVFEKLYQVLASEEAQNERYPELLKLQIQQNPAVDIVPNATGDFGLVPTNPIPVNGPIGELLYLSSLRKEPDEKIAFHRIGSRDGIDIYETFAFHGKQRDVLYLNMYFPKKSSLAPRGYQVKARSGEDVRFLRGVNHLHETFPIGLYPAAAQVANRLFGMTLVDTELRNLKDDEVIPSAIEKVRFQWATMADLENRGDIFVLFQTNRDGSVLMTCEQLPKFSKIYSSIAAARESSPYDLSDHVSKLAGGTCSIWTPDQYGHQKTKKK